MTASLVECPGHTGHAPSIEIQGGRPLKAFDQVERMELILGACEPLDLIHVQPERFGLSPILQVHDEDMVNFLQLGWPTLSKSGHAVDGQVFADTYFHAGLGRSARGRSSELAGNAAEYGLYCFDTITGIGENTTLAAMASVDTGLTGARLLLENQHHNVVALTRPPGHHVGRRVFGGGCYFNNAAIAARRLRDHGAARVAILDIDFHHGNGTQDIFYNDPSVLYVSLHGHPNRTFPFFTGYPDEIGCEEGSGYNLNIPLPEGVPLPAYRRMLQRGLAAIDSFGPDFLVISLGFDSVRNDPSGDGALEPTDFETIGRDIADLGVPMLAVLEGGYDLQKLGSCFTSWLAGTEQEQ